MPVLDWSCARRSLSFLVLVGGATVLGRSALAQATPRGSTPRGIPATSPSSSSVAGSPTGMPLNGSVGTSTLLSQTLSSGLADHSVHFYYIPAPGAAAVDGRHLMVLKQRISVALDGVTLSHALDVIAAKAGLRVTYGTRQANAGPLDADVTLHADNITVEAALTDVLADAGLDVQLSDGVMALVPQGGTGGVAARQGYGRIAGRVLDTATALPVQAAQIRLDELNTGALTEGDGRFLFPRVPVGHYHLTVRRVGFLAKTVAVTVPEDGTVDVTVQIQNAPTQLDEVVSTANGDQRRSTIGNDIAAIHVDSIAQTTPVMDITDLISSRAPGVEVLENNGEVGNGASLRIRGQTSLVLAGDPIIIVDGVRIDNTPGGSASPLFNSGIPSPSRINDIDFNDVESIDVLKGPSAATEYGTDAANGVIVIKTKHAHSAGPPKWTITAEQAWSQVGTGFPETYYAYGHTTGPEPRATQCPMIPNSDNVGVSWSDGTCTVDSIVKFNALNNSKTTIFGTGTREKVNLSVEGGTDAARYYIGGGLTNETGPLKMPTVFEHSADSIGLPRSLWDPNSNNQRSIRANTTAKLSKTLDVAASAAYMTNQMQAPSSPNLYETTYTSAPQNNAGENFGWGPGLDDTPVYEYGNIVTQQVQRFTGGLTLNWNPWSWFQAHLTGGLDHQSLNATSEIYPEAAQLYPTVPAQLGIQNGTRDVYSLDFRSAITVPINRDVKSTSSFGLQMIENRAQATYAQGDISQSNQTLNGLTDALTYQTGGPTATLGGYIEEQVGLWERLYLTGAVRLDDGSSFGNKYPAVIYPKASVSWLALPTNANTSLRVRGAYGQSGNQPPPGAALLLFGTGPAYLNGGSTTVPTLLNAANPNLQPERTSEFEGGADLGFLHGRLNVNLTGYYKETDNALVATGAGWEVGSPNNYENIGEVTNGGFEATISATLIANRQVNWDMQLNGSTNHNNLVKLAPGITSQYVYGDHAVFRFTPGTPLYGYAAEQEHWNGQTQNGVVTQQDVTIDDTLSYAGPSQPTRMASFTTHLSLFHGRLTFGTLFDYRGGFRLLCTTCFHSATYDQSDYASNFANAPIWEQVRDVATNEAYTKGLDGYAPSMGFYEDAQYVRWRELSATYALPDRWAHKIGMLSLSLTGAVRNVLLITPYTGGDPEVTSSEGDNVTVQPTTGQLGLNHDVREGAQAIPLSRYFVLRLNAGF